MNFLSHYYFERNNKNSYEVLGCLLPDLVKNADKSWNLYPEKNTGVNYSKDGTSILNGWKRHLDVDKIFHNTTFFFFHQHTLKKGIKHILSDTVIKPFFIGHIGIELCLDHLLIRHNKINIRELYTHLEAVDPMEIEKFLLLNGISNPEKFSTYFHSFKKEQYLKSYEEVGNLSYAIKRICMRIWQEPLTDLQMNALTDALDSYISHLKDNFMIIFDDIESQIIND
ncbi:hypothetical protein EIM50_16680 [Pseudoxanthomonas sp. SGD-10]|nr:hypothetical protein EIM50_16680 [Pseudoxanthomonas sp. SGD-10]